MNKKRNYWMKADASQEGKNPAVLTVGSTLTATTTNSATAKPINVSVPMTKVVQEALIVKMEAV
jgi:hypothetical protein